MKSPDRSMYYFNLAKDIKVRYEQSNLRMRSQIRQLTATKKELEIFWEKPEVEGCVWQGGYLGNARICETDSMKVMEHGNRYGKLEEGKFLL